MEQRAAGMTAAWCRHCDGLVTVNPASGLAVHAGEGGELCADGQHVAAPIASDPAMRKAAAAIAAEFPQWVVAWYLTHFGAWPLDFPAAAVEAATEDELRAALAARRPAAGALP